MYSFILLSVRKLVNLHQAFSYGLWDKQPSDLGLHLRQLKNPTITLFIILHSKPGFPLLIFSSSPPENLNRRG
ncbi:hypothetical protein L2E82_32118 [Cichorium intybus]|uniref:Uncharacterized protein n=1 Tax=Cichorium intybus TaxID=13427 RepID=A0ACB9BFI1_CICIN|nr:hypothetical protein L2E82_32118 [Cichorium intybus]